MTPTPTRPSATEQPAQPQTLDQFLSQTNLPRQFTYGGLRWQAQDFGQYGMRSGIQMATIGPAISGHKLYYEKGTPTSPYETLYLRGEDQYRDWFVRYSSVGPAQGTGATTRQGPSAMGNQTPSAGPMHQGVSLTQMLNNTGLPMQFTYNNRTWKATDFGDYSQSGAQLSDTGDSAGGHALYYQMGSSTSPYNTLYMKAGSAYPNTWVKYTPTGK